MEYVFFLGWSESWRSLGAEAASELAGLIVKSFP